jgi:hypothetical protein
MIGGWFIGNFSPSIHKTKDFEICIKRYDIGSTEPKHFQRVATEITVIISGLARIGENYLNAGDIITIEPFEALDFEAISNVTLVAIKFPSIPDDKVIS